jgi:hypothetical protein
VAQIRKSDGTTLNVATNPITNRNMVKVGHATVVTPGVTGFDVIKLKTPTLDTTYVVATVVAPVIHGVDDIRFTPTQYPEKL